MVYDGMKCSFKDILNSNMETYFYFIFYIYFIVIHYQLQPPPTGDHRQSYGH